MRYVGLLVLAALTLSMTPAHALEQAKKTAGGKVTSVAPSAQGGITIPGNNQIFRPVSPEEAEKLGREGVKRKMMEQKR